MGPCVQGTGPSVQPGEGAMGPVQPAPSATRPTGGGGVARGVGRGGGGAGAGGRWGRGGAPDAQATCCPAMVCRQRARVRQPLLLKARVVLSSMVKAAILKEVYQSGGAVGAVVGC